MLQSLSHSWNMKNHILVLSLVLSFSFIYCMQRFSWVKQNYKNQLFEKKFHEKGINYVKAVAIYFLILFNCYNWLWIWQSSLQIFFGTKFIKYFMSKCIMSQKSNAVSRYGATLWTFQWICWKQWLKMFFEMVQNMIFQIIRFVIIIVAKSTLENLKHWRWGHFVGIRSGPHMFWTIKKGQINNQNSGNIWSITGSLRQKYPTKAASGLKEVYAINMKLSRIFVIFS